MDIELIKQHVETGAHHFLLSLKKEAYNTGEAKDIIRKYVETGHITDEEEKLLKVQLTDSLKIMGIVVPFVLIPGASILMPILISVAKKHDINLMPSVCD